MALKALLLGCGAIGFGLSQDPIMARHWSCATHAEALLRHPEFSLEAVVEPHAERLEVACRACGPTYAAPSLEQLPPDLEPDILVLATPPGPMRLEALQRFPSLRAVLVEKPLGRDPAEAEAFVQACRERGLPAQVNLWRRADRTFRDLAAGGLEQAVGEVRAVFGLYGNGLLNNGVHMIDFCRMLFGEITEHAAFSTQASFAEGPLPGDRNLAFRLRMERGCDVVFLPLRFAEYRENSLDIWGSRGRLALMQEQLWLARYPLAPNRGLSDAREIASDRPEPLPVTSGESLYRMYDNLAHAILAGAPLWSPAEETLAAERIAHDLVQEYPA